MPYSNARNQLVEPPPFPILNLGKWLGVGGVASGIILVVAMVWSLINPSVPADDPIPEEPLKLASAVATSRPVESAPIPPARAAIIPARTLPQQPSPAVATGPRHLKGPEIYKLVQVRYVTQVQQGAMTIEIRNLCSEPLKDVHVAMVYKDPEPEKEYEIVNVPGMGPTKRPRIHEAEFTPHDFPLLGPGQAARCNLVRLGREWDVEVEADIEERADAPLRIIFAKVH